MFKFCYILRELPCSRPGIATKSVEELPMKAAVTSADLAAEWELGETGCARRQS